MKKLIALLLVLVMALSLAACGGGSAGEDAGASVEKAIVGEWKTLDGAVTTFNEDGTGTAPYGGEFSWKYDSGTGWYMMSVEGMLYSCEIKTENEMRFISIEGENYYHTDSYDMAVEANK